MHSQQILYSSTILLSAKSLASSSLLDLLDRLPVVFYNNRAMHSECIVIMLDSQPLFRYYTVVSCVVAAKCTVVSERTISAPKLDDRVWIN